MRLTVRGPEVEIGLAEAELQFDRALRVAAASIRRPGRASSRRRRISVYSPSMRPCSRGFSVGGEGLAALLDHAGEVARELLDIDGCRLGPGSMGLSPWRLDFAVRLSALHACLHMGLHCSRSQDAYRRLFSARDLGSFALVIY